MAPQENSPKLWSNDEPVQETPHAGDIHVESHPTQESDDEDAKEVKPDLWSGLTARIATAMILAFVAFLCLWRGGFCFSAFILLAALVMKKEWDQLTTQPTALLRAGGYAYIILPSASLIWLRNAGESGFLLTLGLIAIISATDIGAYFVGRRFGRHKLAPVISPGKTWEGLAGGIVTATIVWVLFMHSLSWWVAPLIAIIAQAGDLFESAIKRQAGVKDSGTLLPGHGGLLDRFDGYMFAAPVYALIVRSILV